MKTNKRYHSEEQILALIDKFRTQAADLERKANENDERADALRGTSESCNIEGLRAIAEKQRKGISWRLTRIQTLGELLAVMRTPKLPALDDGDTSVASV